MTFNKNSLGWRQRWRQRKQIWFYINGSLTGHFSLPGVEERGHSSESKAAESQDNTEFYSLCKPLNKPVLQGLSAWQIHLTTSFGDLQHLEHLSGDSDVIFMLFSNLTSPIKVSVLPNSYYNTCSFNILLFPYPSKDLLLTWIKLGQSFNPCELLL